MIPGEEESHERGGLAMRTIALHSTIRAGAIEDYRARHAQVPDELRALFDRAGIRDWRIWRSGDRLFHVVECEDFEQSMDVVDPDPANERWQADIGRFVDQFFGPDGAPGFEPLEEVWSLEEQRQAERG